MTLTIRNVRGAVAAAILGGLLASLLTLAIIGRGGAILDPGMRMTVKYILEFFFPLMGVAGAFYLAERRQQSRGTTPVRDPEAVGFAITIIGLWVTVPTVALILSDTYEAAIASIDIYKLYGSTLAATAVAFVFARSSS